MLVHQCDRVLSRQQSGALRGAGSVEQAHRNPDEFGLRLERLGIAPEFAAMRALCVEKNINGARAHSRADREPGGLRGNRRDRHGRRGRLGAACGTRAGSVFATRHQQRSREQGCKEQSGHGEFPGINRFDSYCAPSPYIRKSGPRPSLDYQCQTIVCPRLQLPHGGRAANRRSAWPSACGPCNLRVWLPGWNRSHP